MRHTSPSPHLSRIAPLLLLACLACPAMAADTASRWIPSVAENGNRRLAMEREMDLFGRPTVLRLAFTVSPHDDPKARIYGCTEIALTVEKADGIGKFHFEDFEGPDAVTHGRNLMKISVVSEGKPFSIEASPNGGFGVESENGFTFSVADLTKERGSPPRKVVDRILAGATSIRVAVSDSRDGKTSIEAEFPLPADSAPFRALLAGVK